MKTAAERWTDFEQTVLPPTVSAIERQEMRRAFYVGFQACLFAAIDIANESDGDDERGAEMMERLHEECREFAAAMLLGHA